VQKTASRGGGYVYTCAVQLDVTDEEDAPPAPLHVLTKREQFAMAAMQGIISSSKIVELVPTNSSVVLESIKLADAMLAALEVAQ
jgi:hypothetical protein